MNVIKYIFTLVLCLGLTGGAMNVSAQTSSGSVLASSNKSLKQSEVVSLIEFYEWAFEAEFTAAEREKFRAFTAAEFRANPTLSRVTIDDIVQTLPRILAAPADLQVETRKNFLALFLPEARKNPDENLRMLLGIYEKAQSGGRTVAGDDSSGGGTTSGDDAISAPQTQRDTNPGGLNGKWFRSEGSGFIDYTGKTQYKSGRTYNFEFFPNGAVEYVSETDVLSIVQCRTKSSEKARGTYAVNGDSLTINLGATSSVGSSSCNAKDNYKKTLPASSVSVKFVVKKMESITRPDNPTMLCFDGENGETCYERVKQ
jgi:hypothetical protein